MKKIILILSVPLLLSSCFWNKEKNGKVETTNINQSNTITTTGNENIEVIPVVKDVKEMSFVELSNSLYGKNGGDNLKQKIDSLTTSGSSIEDNKKAVYLKSFVGDYKNALIERNDLCKKDNSACKKVNLDLTSYRPSDTDGMILDKTDIYIDGEKIGSLKAKNSLTVYDNFMHRVKVSKKGYLDFFAKFGIGETGLDSESLNPKMLKADEMETVFSGTGITKSTSNYTYTIEANSFTTKDGKSVVGNIELYFFDIDGTEGNLNVLNLDAFNSETLSYMGGSMVTHGMPLIKAYKGDTELKIVKPIIGKGKILNLEKMPGLDLASVPKGVYLGIDELAKYNIPAFWSLNQDNGVWMSSEMKILDNEGNYEFQLK